ncbi:MAG: amidohydrolase family protein, partial [Candidatus Dormibacteraeota bacterium]|nr:amidohydrolase family protein [Candidatus Dormibacteraeota bacterium]
MSPSGAFAIGNQGGARVLGRDDVGTIEVGKRADLALYQVDDLGRAGIADPLTAIALAPPARAEAVVVDGRVVVREGRLLTADEEELAREIGAASRRLQEVHHA